MNLRKKKRLISFSYNPNRTLIANHVTVLSKKIDNYTTKYDNLLFWGYFTAGLEDAWSKTICLAYSLTSMINKPTCYKNPEKPSCIDLIRTNCPCSFQNLCFRDRLIRFS